MTAGGGSGRRLKQEWQWHRERAVARARQGCAGVQAGQGSATGESGSAGGGNEVKLKSHPPLYFYKGFGKPKGHRS